jgi:Uncharacterized protein conserved in bacteria (DUF2188)
MNKVVYQIVEHDGGWAYKVDGVFSETFPSHGDALAAANIAAREQQLGGSTEGIAFQDAAGKWHEEIAQGKDRPSTEVEDQG